MKTALVTGGNKGIGFAACRGLAEKGFKVYLGSRDAKRGAAAVDALHREGFSAVELLELDTSDAKSIEAAAATLAKRTDHLDVLVNNAGIFIDGKATGLTVGKEVIIDTFTTNTLGPLLLTRALSPLLAKAGQAQVINVSSGMGQLSDMNGGSAAYRLSKVSLNGVTRILANELAAQHIRVNSICPGWVRTDMGGASAPRTAEQGADTIVWLATGMGGQDSGGFYRDRTAIPW